MDLFSSVIPVKNNFLSHEYMLRCIIYWQNICIVLFIGNPELFTLIVSCEQTQEHTHLAFVEINFLLHGNARNSNIRNQQEGHISYHFSSNITPQWSQLRLDIFVSPVFLYINIYSIKQKGDLVPPSSLMSLNFQTYIFKYYISSGTCCCLLSDIFFVPVTFIPSVQNCIFKLLNGIFPGNIAGGMINADFTDTRGIYILRKGIL